MSDTVVDINPENWKSEALESDLPVLADFWAEWCGPCKALAPVVEQVAQELEGKLKVVKVDVDKNRELAAEFGIRSVPTLLIVKDGVVQSQMVGALSKSDLMEKLAEHI